MTKLCRERKMTVLLINKSLTRYTRSHAFHEEDFKKCP